MTSPEPAASLRELQQLQTRVERLDEHGSRGVAGITTGLAEVIKDVGRLEGVFTAHTTQHERERQERITGRRWLTGTVLAVLAILVTMLGLLIQIAARPLH